MDHLDEHSIMDPDVAEQLAHAILHIFSARQTLSFDQKHPSP
jgi:hypothetical protein